MTPNENMRPSSKALAVLFDHPELLTLDHTKAQAIQTLIANPQKNPHFADVWQYISANPLDGNAPWAAKVPIILEDGKPATDKNGNTLYQWSLSSKMCTVIQTPLA